MAGSFSQPGRTKFQREPVKFWLELVWFRPELNRLLLAQTKFRLELDARTLELVKGGSELDAFALELDRFYLG